MKTAIENLEQAAVDQQCRSLPAGGGGTVRRAGGGGHQTAADLPALSGSPARRRTGRARTQHDRTATQGRLACRVFQTLEEFDFSQAPQVPATKIHDLAQGGYIERAEPVILIGDCGTGKTHLLTGLCVAACRQKRRVRFATAAALVNELVEAKQQLQLRRVLARWERYDLIAIDEVGYVPMAELGAEFLFQVIAERAEKATVILTTNLPFFRVDAGHPQRPPLQGVAGPHHRSRPHPRNRHR